MIAMKVGDEYGGGLAGFESQAFEGAERGGTAVEKHRVLAVMASKVDAGLVPAAATKGVAAAGEGDGNGWWSGRGHCPIVAP